jgi:FG-GAP repeat
MNVGPSTTGALLVAALTAVIPACQPVTSDSEDTPPLAAAPSASRVKAPGAPEAGTHTRGAVPPELRADYIRTVQARAAAAYRVEPMAAATLRARSRGQGLVAELSPEGVQITNEASGGTSGGLALAGFGCEDQRAAVRAALPRADGNRVEYARGELLEWYASGPLGLEQGFTVAAPPPCRAQGSGPVVVELAIRGALHAELVAQGARVELRDATGRGAFTYSDLFARDAAGRTLAATMSVHDDRLLLHVDDAGAVYPLQIDPLISTQQAKLLASDGEDFDLFGLSVAVSGDTAVVGANRDDDKGTDAGAVYVFVRSGTTWTQQAKLTAADGGAFDNFGTSVAVSGNTALVGSMFDSDVVSGGGSAYVFVRSGTTWTQQAKLLAADGQVSDQLGISVALEGDTAVVGTVDDDDNGERSGSAYVFVRSGTTWTQQAKLLAADGVEFDQFAISVAVSADTAVVGAYGRDDNGRSSGAAYVFVRSGTAWTQQTKLLAGDGAEIDEFGISVGVSGNTILVGAIFNDEKGGDSGAAYVFVRDGTSWTQQAKLSAGDGVESDNFGVAVALLGDTALVGAFNDSDRGAASGSAYVFTRSGTSWTQQAKLTAADGASGDLLGISVALSGDTALVGALGDDDLGSSSGSTYVYTPAPAPNNNGGACTTDAECTSGFCTDGVCCNTACGGGASNDCQACSVAAGATVDGTCAPRSAGTVCRGSAGACDVAESCTGASVSCPADGLASAGTVCRGSAGACDVAETCTGASASCPADGLASAGTVCRGSAGACDVAESCTGASAACPANDLAPAGTVCRAAANGCDVLESCTGSAVACPSNEFRPDLSLCHGGLLGLPGLCLAHTCVL